MSYPLNFVKTETNDDFGHDTAVAVVPKTEGVIFKILNALGAGFENRHSNPDNADSRRYRGNGHSYVSRNESGSLEVSISAGCWCEHDCCGHVCGLSYEICQTNNTYVIVRETIYNY